MEKLIADRQRNTVANSTCPKVAVQLLNHADSYRECFYKSLFKAYSEVPPNNNLRKEAKPYYT